MLFSNLLKEILNGRYDPPFIKLIKRNHYYSLIDFSLE